MLAGYVWLHVKLASFILRVLPSLYSSGLLYRAARLSETSEQSYDRAYCSNAGILSFKFMVTFPDNNKCYTTPLIRTLVIRISNNPDRLGPSAKFVENSAKLNSLEITGYRIKYSRVLWLLELQIRRGLKV
jgi:hypothetical protein